MMRLLYTTVMLWGAGCIANDVVEPGSGPAGAPTPGESGSTTSRPPPQPGARLVPTVCDVRSWAAPVDSPDQSVVVVTTPTGGATVLAVARSGGPVRAFTFSKYGMPSTDQGTKLRFNAGDTRLAAAEVDGALMTASITDSTIVVDEVAPDLVSFTEVAKFGGTLVGDVPVLAYRNGRQAVFADASSLTLSTFDDAWGPISSVTAPTPVTALSTATYGDDNMIAWSTATGCFLDRVGAHVGSARDFPCANVHLATDVINERATIVYETPNGLSRTEISPGQPNELIDSTPIAIQATSPRVVSDGLRFWVSYIDLPGDLVVGYIDKAGGFVKTALRGTQPMRDAYALTMLPSDDVGGGGIWVFAADGAGYTAQRLCLVEE